MSAYTIPCDLVAPIFNPATFADRPRVESIFSRLRADYPLGLAEVPGYDPHWVVTRYDDVKEVLRLGDVFHSGDRSKTPASQLAEQMMRDYSGGKPHIFRTLVHMDDPDHSAYRKVTSAQFLPAAVAPLEDSVREIARGYIDKMLSGAPTIDFASEIAMYYPLEVVCTLIGLPKPDHATMLRLTQWFLSYADPDLCRPGSNLLDPEHMIRTWQIVYDEFCDYYGKVIADRRTCPRDDVATVIANGQVHGCPMDERSMISYFVIMSTAGHDTTAATTANAMWTLAQRPDLLARLKDEPSAIPGFVEEAIRWTSPVLAFIRSATQDYTLSGRPIKAGDLLYVSYFSASRDDTAFEDPYDFRVDRRTNRHMSFGYGPHVCLGQHLARLEMRVFWEELLPRLESVTMAGDGQWQHSEFACGPKSVPIRYTMR